MPDRSDQDETAVAAVLGLTVIAWFNFGVIGMLAVLVALVAWETVAWVRLVRRINDPGWKDDSILAWSRESKAPCSVLGHELGPYGCEWGCDDFLVFPGTNTGTGSGFIEHNGDPYAFYVADSDKRFKFHVVKRRFAHASGWYGLWLFDRTVSKKAWQEIPDAGMSLDYDGVDLYYVEHGKVPPSQQEEAALRLGTPARHPQPRRAGDAAAERWREAFQRPYSR